MDPNNIRIGDEVSESSVGAGTVTDITEAGYPQVDRVAVAWLKRLDGETFDPHGHVGGSRSAREVPKPLCLNKSCRKTSACFRHRCDFPGAGA